MSVTETKKNGEIILELQRVLEENKKNNSKNIDGNLFFNDVPYPNKCYRVEGQSDLACELADPSELSSGYSYKIDVGLQNIYATKDTLLKGVSACFNSFKESKSGIVTVSGMSAKKFNTTRPDTPTSQHNFGRAFDVKLQGRMKSNGNNYDPLACSILCLFCVEAGATKVFFSDQQVVNDVNKVTGKNVCQNIPGHENHIHMDCR